MLLRKSIDRSQGTDQILEAWKLAKPFHKLFRKVVVVFGSWMTDARISNNFHSYTENSRAVFFYST